MTEKAYCPNCEEELNEHGLCANPECDYTGVEDEEDDEEEEEVDE